MTERDEQALGMSISQRQQAEDSHRTTSTKLNWLRAGVLVTYGIGAPIGNGLG